MSLNIVTTATLSLLPLHDRQIPLLNQYTAAPSSNAPGPFSKKRRFHTNILKSTLTTNPNHSSTSIPAVWSPLSNTTTSRSSKAPSSASSSRKLIQTISPDCYRRMCMRGRERGSGPISRRLALRRHFSGLCSFSRRVIRRD